mgnify:CR=1 FL=1
MRDRLRAVECPSDVIDQIGGWLTQGVGNNEIARQVGLSKFAVSRVKFAVSRVLKDIVAAQVKLDRWEVR